MPEVVSRSSKNAHWHRTDRIKRCIMCGEERPLYEFYSYPYVTRQGKQSTRYEGRCKPCAKERRKARSAANPGMDATCSRKRREQKPDWYKEYGKKYRASERGRQIKAFCQRVRKHRAKGVLTFADELAIRAIYEEATRLEETISICPVFDLPELGKELHVDHIIPLAGGGEHHPDNLQILPAGLNMRKGAKTHSAWAREVRDA